METLLINEKFVSQFKYWREGQIRTGMRFRNNLFEHSAVFSQRQRHEAFDLAGRLEADGRAVVVTASADQYRVWLSLRSSKEEPSNCVSAAEPSASFDRVSQELLLAVSA